MKYECAGFLEKNKDRMSSDAGALLHGAANPLVASLFVAEGADAAAASGPSSFVGATAFLGSKFKDDMHRLLATLRATDPHFIRCVKVR